MSNYEDYTNTSGNYDRTRLPVGVEIITGCLAQSKTKFRLESLRVQLAQWIPLVSPDLKGAKC